MKDQNNNKTQDWLEVTMPLEVAQAALAAMNKVFLDWDVLNDEAPKFLKHMQDLTYYVERVGGGV
ncbi:hypothetical protein [Acinetobacter johnsonii]|uniref:hypothetical protein n=1 Tax=Acinetobacter johnsonii TaxID=40214 RepID=UPI003AF8A6DE